jgi:hypothetical protein
VAQGEIRLVVLMAMTVLMAVGTMMIYMAVLVKTP